jgi:hypothetical protein
MIDVQGIPDVLGVMPAAVDEGAARLQMRGVAYGRRRRNPARLGHELDAGGDVDGVAEYGLRFVDDDLAQMQPDAEHQSLFLVERFVEACHPLLDVDRRRDRRHRRAEFGQHGVGHDVNDPPAGGFDGRPPHLRAHRFQATDGAVFRAFHQAHIAVEVGLKNGRKPAATGRAPVFSRWR